MFNGQHARVPAMCGHFKNQRTKEPLIEFEDTLMPPTIETYQVLWADDYQTELPPPPTWKEKGKGRAEEEPQLFGRPKQQGKWNHTLCLAYGEILPDKRLWNDGTPIENAWKQALNRLDGYPHDDHKIWRMASTKAKGAMSKEIREIKDNSWMPEYTEPNYPENNFFTDNPDAFQN
ncbi:hypothetical protein G9A89_011357 [Geosiphon pyriformis]|nr:hypothetical protein G9A89_011357 [Geosiphon pyriformis]